MTKHIHNLDTHDSDPDHCVRCCNQQQISKLEQIKSLEAERDRLKNILQKIKAEVAERNYGEWGNKLHAFLKEAGI